MNQNILMMVLFMLGMAITAQHRIADSPTTRSSEHHTSQDPPVASRKVSFHVLGFKKTKSGAT